MRATLLLAALLVAAAQPPKIHVKCNPCSQEFLKTELTLVDFVVDPHDAELRVRVVGEDTGAGGTRYTVFFEGAGRFAGQDQTLTFTMEPQSPDADFRASLARTLKAGLVPYLLRSGLADRLEVQFGEREAAGKSKDPWDHWSMTARLQSMFDGQSAGSYANVNGGFSADRVTPELKVSLGVTGALDRNTFVVGDETIVNSNVSRSASAFVAKSLSDHWSLGVGARANSSSYGNTALNVGVAPALEYDVFPYSESTKRQLRVKYEAGPSHASYVERTIHDRTEETLLSQTLSVALDVKKAWGTFQASPYVTNYLNHFETATAGLSTTMSWNVVKGLALDLSANASAIHGQRELSAQGATRDEILLRSKELESSFHYWVMAGFRYTFGSKDNSVVNPRFGG